MISPHLSTSLILMALTQTPADTSGLHLLSARRQATLQVATRERTTLYLTLPDEVTFKNAHISRLVVRTAGRQDSMLDGLDRNTSVVNWQFKQPGAAVVLLEAGPPSLAGLSDAWQRTTYCARMVVRVAPPAGVAAPDGDPGIMAKAGQKIEIMPLVDPLRMRPGDDMGVRVYFDGNKQPGRELTITGPGGVSTVRTDAAGTAHFTINAAGDYRVRTTRTKDNTTFTADLLFDVLAEQPEVNR